LSDIAYVALCYQSKWQLVVDTVEKLDAVTLQGELAEQVSEMPNSWNQILENAFC